jgi:hypothetical protein
MRPGRPCRICADSVLAAKVDSLRAAGESLRAIAALTGADRFSVQRHCKHGGPQAETEDKTLSEVELSDRRLAALADQLRSQYAAACSAGDNRVALDCTKALTRIESERHRRIIDRKQAEADADASDPIKAGTPSPAYLDYIKNKVRNAYASQIATHGWVWCPMGCGRPVNPQTIPERIRIYQETHDNSSATN